MFRLVTALCEILLLTRSLSAYVR